MRNGSRRRLVIAALTAVGISSLVGCVLLERFQTQELPFGFPHSIHVQDEGMDCTDCHTQAEDADDPGMPVLAQCMLCHADIDADKPPEKRIDKLFDGDKLIRSDVATLPDEVRFPHQRHVAAYEDCATCHTGIASNEHVQLLPAITMSRCLDCHAKEQAHTPAPGTDCQTCHTEVGKDWRPPNHERDWIRLHGSVSRAESGLQSESCSLCHTERSCAQCHEEEPPASHTNHWRLRGHGVAAAFDRESCATCHRSDFCVRCHESTRPLGHSGMWGGTRSTHCLNCHFPLQEEDRCSVCHLDTPSHLQAAPLPSNHDPSFNCRMCHGNGVPLPHVDKGDLCITCHM